MEAKTRVYIKRKRSKKSFINQTAGDLSSSKLGIQASQIFLENGSEVEDINEIAPQDILFISGNTIEDLESSGGLEGSQDLEASNGKIKKKRKKSKRHSISESSEEINASLLRVTNQLSLICTKLEENSQNTESIVRELASSMEKSQKQFSEILLNFSQQIQKAPQNQKNIGGALPLNQLPKECKYLCKNTYNVHTGPIWGLCLTKELLISGSEDTTIKLHSVSADLKSLKLHNTFSGHEGIVHALAVYKTKTLLSGSDDKMIKVWDLSEMKCTHTIETAHDNTVCELHVSGAYLFSGSFMEIKVWNLQNMKHVAQLTGHAHWVYSIISNEKYLFSGSHNMIKVHDLATLQEVTTIQFTHGKSIYCLAVTEKYLLAGTYEKNNFGNYFLSDSIWDVETFEAIDTIRAHEASVLSFAISGDKLFSGSYDTSIKIWDLNSFKCLQTLEGSGKVESLVSYEDAVFSGSTDSSVKIWKE